MFTPQIRTRLCGLALAVGLFTLAGCQPPVIHTEEGFRATEALYTAVTSQKPELLDQSEQRIDTLLKSGQLSASAYGKLNAVVKQARAGNRRAAAEHLDWLLRNQPAEHPH